MAKQVIIFGGTTEGRMLAEYLAHQRVSVHVCTATEYGESLLPRDETVSASSERMDAQQMQELILAQKPDYVIDATHPYAAEVTENIRAACAETKVKRIRLVRENSDFSDVTCVENTREAVAFLEETKGNVLLTTGSKELEAYTALSGYQDRVYARVLSLPEVAAACAAMGFTGRHLICMQGPFTRELNEAMCRQLSIRYLVTKESGKAGGFQEKYEAARACHVRLVVIGRPLLEEGMSLWTCRRFLAERYALSVHPEISLVGIGMGSAENMTREAQQICEEAQLLIGARRMLEAAAGRGKHTFTAYDPQVICDYIREHPEYEKIAVLLSGDSGFYSGAKRLTELLGADTRIVSGISSVSYFASRLGMSWDDMYITSIHGRRENLTAIIQRHRKTFFLIGEKDGISALSKTLLLYDMKDITLHLGERLSYPDERIQTGHPQDFQDLVTDTLVVAVAENPSPMHTAQPIGIADERFSRGRVPMTKEEVRTVSVSKLALTEDSIVYDIGAGTGSISVETARIAWRGQIYAIEKNPDAVALIRKNAVAFRTENLNVVQGLAPEALRDLPMPTHAFIGGSSGNLQEILTSLLLKNPTVRIVLNAITLETVTEALSCVKDLPLAEEDLVQLQTSRSRQVGHYHMMMGQNPVYILTLRGVPGKEGSPT